MDVVVSVHEGCSPAEVAVRLQAVGLYDAEALEELGVVTGSIDPSLLQALVGVEGVSAVEQARDFRL